MHDPHESCTHRLGSSPIFYVLHHTCFYSPPPTPTSPSFPPTYTPLHPLLLPSSPFHFFPPTEFIMKLFSRTPSPLSIGASSISSTRTPSAPPSPAPRRRLRHGTPPFFQLWANIRNPTTRKYHLRYLTLSGTHLRYSATPCPLRDVLARSILVYAANISEDRALLRIHIRSGDERLVIVAENKHDHAAMLAELQRASCRFITDVYTFQRDAYATAYGRSSAAIEKESGRSVSIKIACKSGLSPHHLAGARREAAVLLSMEEHHNVVQLVDIYESQRSLYLVFNHTNAITLEHIVQQRGVLCEAEVACIIRQCSPPLVMYMHIKSYIDLFVRKMLLLSRRKIASNIMYY